MHSRCCHHFRNVFAQTTYLFNTNGYFMTRQNTTEKIIELKIWKRKSFRPPKPQSVKFAQNSIQPYDSWMSNSPNVIRCIRVWQPFEPKKKTFNNFWCIFLCVFCFIPFDSISQSAATSIQTTEYLSVWINSMEYRQPWRCSSRHHNHNSPISRQLLPNYQMLQRRPSIRLVLKARPPVNRHSHKHRNNRKRKSITYQKWRVWPYRCVNRWPPHWKWLPIVCTTITAPTMAPRKTTSTITKHISIYSNFLHCFFVSHINWMQQNDGHQHSGATIRQTFGRVLLNLWSNRIAFGERIWICWSILQWQFSNTIFSLFFSCRGRKHRFSACNKVRHRNDIYRCRWCPHALNHCQPPTMDPFRIHNICPLCAHKSAIPKICTTHWYMPHKIYRRVNELADR